LGVLAAFVTGGSALAYAMTATRRFLAGVAVGGLCGVLLFVVWIDLYEVAGGSS
jgi:ribonuclease PH